MMGLPPGVSLSDVANVLIPVGLVTLALRAVPFQARKYLSNAGIVEMLGMTMPVGVMTVLVVYTLSSQPQYLWQGLVCIVVTLALHLWKRLPALSIFGGTGLYMLLVNFL